MQENHQVKERPEGLNNSLLHISETDTRQKQLYYSLDEMYMFTYEYVSGSTPGDYMNVITISGDRSYFAQESPQYHNLFYKTSLQHTHDFLELMIVLEGSIYQAIEGEEFTYPAGSCCLVGRGLRHSEGFGGAARLLFLGISPGLVTELEQLCRTSTGKCEQSFLDSVLFQFMLKDQKAPGERRYLDILPRDNDKTLPRLVDMAETIAKTHLELFFGSSYMVLGQLCQLLEFITDPALFSCSPVEKESGGEYHLFSLVSGLMQEYGGRITRAQLEEKLNYSGDYLNRIVKRFSGMSLYEYGMTYCMKRAENDLKKTDDSIAEIALRCGFLNKTHFYKWFRQLFGMTPKEYRDQFRNK